ncbi:helix-turn-helix domain-containing protein [Cryptosporangium sp. NPDC051539]|uniref:helix-turn-helix domain-containing protein n=1 Tax=Cryptosporangium sp. NPDC051539 TaxID=3363962 RepID=UPI00378931D4
MNVAHRLSRSADRGHVLRRYRQLADLTQAEVGLRINRSGAAVCRLENGGARHADVDTLLRLSDVLDIPLDELGITPRGGPTPHRTAGRVGPIERGDAMQRRTLLTALVGLGVTGALGASAAPPQAELAPQDAPGALVRARASFAAGHYADTQRLLPPIIRAADASPRLVATLVQAYALLSEVSTKVGGNGRAWAAADQALAIARDSGDPALTGLAATRLAVAMRRDGDTADALTLLGDAAQRLTSERALPLRGSMLLTAAYTAAVAGDRQDATGLLGEAEQIAARVPATARFSTPIADGYAISVHSTLGDSARAVQYASRLRLDQLPTGERRARAAVDAFHAWNMHGDADRAVASLHTAERHAPQELRRATVQQRARAMLDRPGHEPAGLRQLLARSAMSV